MAALGNARPRRVDFDGPLGIGGKQNSTSGTTTVALVGEIGDVFYLREDDLRASQRGGLAAAFFQAAAGSVKVDYTLVNAERACDPNPAVQAQIPWVNEITISTTPIVQAAVAFTAIRVTFVTAGEFYAYGR